MQLVLNFYYFLFASLIIFFENIDLFCEIRDKDLSFTKFLFVLLLFCFTNFQSLYLSLKLIYLLIVSFEFAWDGLILEYGGA